MEDKNRSWMGELDLALSEVIREVEREGPLTGAEGDLLERLQLGALTEIKRGIRNAKK